MDPDACQIVIDEDGELWDYSMERYLDMKGLNAKLMKGLKTEGSTEIFLSYHFVAMQKRMQTFIKLNRKESLLNYKKKRTVNSNQ